MLSPKQLMFTRKIVCTVPYSLDICIENIQQFKPSLTVETQVTVMDSTFVIRYGDQSQMKLWAVGTLASLDDNTTQIDVQIGIDREHSNLKYVFGLSIVVWMMALSEGLTEELDWDSLFIVAGLFFLGFWILLITLMTYTQRRFRRDLIQTLCTN
jgi:hypothetical protein